ncbi:MAG: hypothetical protein K1X28_09330 [Parachlamydiales bacterium]|nr:hypothetical protein [Parachlamydiales bacterium]
MAIAAGAKSLHDKYHDLLRGVADEIEPGSQDWIQLFPDDAEGPGAERLKTYGSWLAAHKLANLILASLDNFLSNKAKRSEELLQYRRKFQAIVTQFADQLPIVAKKLETWIYKTTTKSRPLLWTKSWFKNNTYLNAHLAELPRDTVLKITDYEMRVVLETYSNGQIDRKPIIRMSSIDIQETCLARILDCRTNKEYEIALDGTRKDVDDEKED